LDEAVELMFAGEEGRRGGEEERSFGSIYRRFGDS